jgi:hypothetical protein
MWILRFPLQPCCWALDRTARASGRVSIALFSRAPPQVFQVEVSSNLTDRFGPVPSYIVDSASTACTHSHVFCRTGGGKSRSTSIGVCEIFRFALLVSSGGWQEQTATCGGDGDTMAHLALRVSRSRKRASTRGLTAEA